MSEVEAFDQASLEAFTSGLVEAGFEPVSGSDRRMWKGRIRPSFEGLTDATNMLVMLRDGWPFTSPVLLVDGLHTNHLTVGGYVCLWHEGDSSGEWLTADGFIGRIDEWCDQAKNGWDRRGLARDAYLNFVEKHGAVVTYDLAALQIGGAGGWGNLHATVLAPWRVDLAAGTAPAPSLAGLWFHVGSVDLPPRNLDELRSTLNRSQRRGLDRSIAARADVDTLHRSGGVDLIAFRWDSEDVRHLLVVALGGTGAHTEAHVLRDGPMDERSLTLRAGPLASVLRGKSAVIFGAGAIGGHVAVCVASSGLGTLRIVDSDQLVPGNVVRHVVGHRGVGVPKAYAVEVQVNEHAPWTTVETTVAAPSSPTQFRDLLLDVDLIIDATGTEAVTGALAATAIAVAKPLVSAALYRAGAIGRVRRQGMQGDAPLADRIQAGYPLIPPGDADDELVEPSVGCSAPANNAPPASVLACASLLAQAAVDALSGSCALPDEMTDVYTALPGEAPYDVVGRVRW